MFKMFKVGELFDIHPTATYKMKNNELFASDGATPVLSNSSMNNGIGGYCGLTPTEQGEMITFSDTTTGADTMFYQSGPFIGYPHVQGMYPYQPNKWDEKCCLYVISCIRKSAGNGWNYAVKFNRALVKELFVELPVVKSSDSEHEYTVEDIDFEYMKKCIAKLEKERIAELEHVQISDPASVLYEQNTSAYSKAPGSPEAPTKDGYVFAGWYDDTACTQPHDFDAQMPAHNVTVYAKWIKTQYQVTIHDGSASGNEYAGGYHNPSYVGYDGTVEEPQVNRGPEWEFVGWYVDEACTQPFTFGYHLNKTTEPTLGIDAETPSPDNYVAGKMDL